MSGERLHGIPAIVPVEERAKSFGDSSITDKIHVKMGREGQGREEGERRDGGQRVFIAGPSCVAHVRSRYSVETSGEKLCSLSLRNGNVGN